MSGPYTILHKPAATAAAMRIKRISKWRGLRFIAVSILRRLRCRRRWRRLLLLLLLLAAQSRLSRHRLGAGDLDVRLDDAFLLFRVQDQVAALPFRRRGELRAAVVEQADRSRLGQFEIAFLRADGVEQRGHSARRRVVRHRSVRAVSVDYRMGGRPCEILFTA